MITSLLKRLEKPFLFVGQRYSHKLLTIYILFVVIAIFSIFIQKQKKGNNPQAELRSSNASSPSIVPNPYITPCLGDEKTYLNRTSLVQKPLEKTVDPKTSQRIRLVLHDTNALPEGIKSDYYSYSDKLHAITYISRQSTSGTNDVNDLRAVHIYFLDTKEDRKVLEVRNKGKSEAEYVFGLTDSGFSDDGKYLSILTSEDLYLYDMETHAITHEFHEGRPANIGIGGVFSYGNPKFSKDDSKILLNVGYYEGGGSIVYDRNTKKITNLPYSMYGEGDSALDWYNGKLLLFRLSFNKDLKQEITDLKLVDFPSLTETTINSLDMENVLVYFDKDQSIYISGDISTPSGVMNCQRGNRSEVTSTMNPLYKVDIPTGTSSKVLEVDATNGVGYMNIRDMTSLDGRLFLKFVKEYEGNFSIQEVIPNTFNTVTDLQI